MIKISAPDRNGAALKDFKPFPVFTSVFIYETGNGSFLCRHQMDIDKGIESMARESLPAMKALLAVNITKAVCLSPMGIFPSILRPSPKQEGQGDIKYSHPASAVQKII